MDQRVDIKTKLRIAIVGGGLSGCLLAYRLHCLKPWFDITLFEKKPQIAGNHTWSFFEEDLSLAQRDWIRPFITKSWPRYEVNFLNTKKVIHSPYYSIQSKQLREVLKNTLGNKIITQIETIDLKGFDFVFDATGFDFNKDPLTGGVQKFYGLDVLLKEPHGLTDPILMDTCVDQKVGYRFFYLLPWDSHRLLVEDTYYTEDFKMDLNQMKTNVLDFVKIKNWTILETLREEQGCLFIPYHTLKDDSPRPSKIYPIGTKAGLFHPVTGYSLPWVVRLVDLISNENSWTHPKIDFLINRFIKDHKKRARFFYLLNRLLFQGAKPHRRHEIFDQFYSLSPELIARFYSGKLKMSDQFKILALKPKAVPLLKAMRALYG